MSKQLGYLDGEPFIAQMEQAVQDGDADLVAANMLRLRQLIDDYAMRMYEIAQLSFRARTIVQQHEPPAAERSQHGSY